MVKISYLIGATVLLTLTACLANTKETAELTATASAVSKPLLGDVVSYQALYGGCDGLVAVDESETDTSSLGYGNRAYYRNRTHRVFSYRANAGEKCQIHFGGENSHPIPTDVVAPTDPDYFVLTFTVRPQSSSDAVVADGPSREATGHRIVQTAYFFRVTTPEGPRYFAYHHALTDGVIQFSWAGRPYHFVVDGYLFLDNGIPHRPPQPGEVAAAERILVMDEGMLHPLTVAQFQSYQKSFGNRR